MRGRTTGADCRSPGTSCNTMGDTSNWYEVKTTFVPEGDRHVR